MLDKSSVALLASRLGNRVEKRVRGFLRDSFLPEAAVDIDTDIEFRFQGHSEFCAIRQGVLTFPKPPAAELVLYFRCQDEAQALLAGSRDVVEAFMLGRIRSNGHLIWVFKVLAAFRGKPPQV